MSLVMRVGMTAVTVAVLVIAHARAEEKEKEPVAIIELGAAGDWDFNGGSSFGPSAAMEFEPIQEWLEIEIGTGPLFSSGHTAWDTDVLFKKPFTLSDKVEFMIGAGPELNYAIGGASKISAEFALDFMFWPWPDRKYGWFVEPSYSYSGTHDQSLGVSLGLLIAIR